MTENTTASGQPHRWAKAIRDAYEEGCWAISTYNDEPTETVDEAWERSDAKCAHDAALAASAPVAPTLSPEFMHEIREACYEAAPVAPAPMHAVSNLTLEPEMRAAMQAVFDAESVPVRPAPLTDTFVQTVPDKCDRIVWRNNYYHLPIAAAPKASPAELPDAVAHYFLSCLCGSER